METLTKIQSPMDYLLLHLIVHLERLSRPLSRLAHQELEVERYLISPCQHVFEYQKLCYG